jgi:hypothetical protein
MTVRFYHCCVLNSPPRCVIALIRQHTVTFFALGASSLSWLCLAGHKVSLMFYKLCSWEVNNFYVKRVVATVVLRLGTNHGTVQEGTGKDRLN